MVSSIEFVRPADLALPELKTLCIQVGVALTREEKVNRGVKLHGTVENQPIAILLYYNQNKGISSKIVFEKMPEDRKTLFINSLSSTKSSGVKAIPIHASITVADKNASPGVKSWGQVLQSHISKIIMLDVIIFGIIHKKVGSDFTGETFRVLKEKEERQYGEYRTRRLALEAWDKLEAK
ncbi:MAG: hypothetical protein V2A69_15460 [Pseudomonadota bacterium]